MYMYTCIAYFSLRYTGDYDIAIFFLFILIIDFNYIVFSLNVVHSVSDMQEKLAAQQKKVEEVERKNDGKNKLMFKIIHESFSKRDCS